MSEPGLRASCVRLLDVGNGASAALAVDSPKDFVDATRDPATVSFVDAATLEMIATMDHVTIPGPIIAICADTLQTAVGWVQHPWLSHVVSASMLDHPIAARHLQNVLKTLAAKERPRLLDWIEPDVTGRRVRLANSTKRVDRLERMTEFFEAKGVGVRMLQQVRDATEELLTNAFYDAPVAAGVVKKAISRTEDVQLPDDSACDLAYGWQEDLAIVRVRDPFGSLSRRRLVEVLGRCSRTDMQVEVDETMGGAGLGLWRIFSGASFVAISVVKGRTTEFLVGIAKRSGGPRPFAFHLFFRDDGKRRFWQLADAETDRPSVNRSVMIVPKPK